MSTLDYLLESEIALISRPVIVDATRITWPHGSGGFLPYRRHHSSIQDYRHWLETNAYSALLFDGALLQITYEVEAGYLTGHRLAYIPPPFEFDQELLRTAGLLDVFDAYVGEPAVHVITHSTVRFDYDPHAAAPGHPASHLTINSANCRIACAAPVRLGQFVSFVFRHFYSSLWAAHPFLQRLPTTGWGGATLTKDDAVSPHLYWRA